MASLTRLIRESGAMGYYTRIDLFDLQVRPEKAAEVAEALKSAREGGDQPYGLAMMELAHGELWWDFDHSPEGKWRPEEPLIEALAGWCSRGWVAFWSCEGDGAGWAHELDGEWGYCWCSPRRVSALRAAETRRFRAREKEENT